MAVRTIKTVEANTAPPIVLTLKRDGVAIDVTGCVVNLILAKGSTVTNTGHQECSLITPSSGVVQYDPETGDFPSAGNYKADAQIVYPSGKQEILYDQLKFKARKKIS